MTTSLHYIGILPGESSYPSTLNSLVRCPAAEAPRDSYLLDSQLLELPSNPTTIDCQNIAILWLCGHVMTRQPNKNRRKSEAAMKAGNKNCIEKQICNLKMPKTCVNSEPLSWHVLTNCWTQKSGISTSTGGLYQSYSNDQLQSRNDALLCWPAPSSCLLGIQLGWRIRPGWPWQTQGRECYHTTLRTFNGVIDHFFGVRPRSKQLGDSYCGAHTV